jgi:murein DD-endopeptidase MepM/ murein hydrolase activator NlpD
VYEKRTLDGQAASDGKILAAKFINAGQEYRAYYFEVNGEGSHYDGEGHELVRQFLRAPLSYRYISSGFTGARYHPITKTVTAHYQIDYAAPSGTPVVATARGTLASAGWEGGWGNIIRLKHDNGYTTHYGHLSAFAKNLRTIGSVSQGQVIGYVGSTGWSTGPHLDYGLKLNGAPINPLSLKLPKGNPLVENDKDIFQKTKETFDVLLD